MVHWNLGSSWWEGKITEIQALILQTAPDLLYISEANLRNDTPANEKDIEGYYMVLPNTSLQMGYSRLILLVKEGVRIEIMDDCMSQTVPAIWIKVISRGRKPLVLGGMYREQHLLLQQQPNNTNEPRFQLSRWKTFIECWKKAARGNKCILIGDLNLDYAKWNNQEYRHKKLVQITKDEMETLGFCQLVNTMTRFWPGCPPSLVDHIWTNAPGCIMSSTNSVRSASDHNMLTVTVRTKDRQEQEHDMTRRDRRHMDMESYKRRIKNIDWTEFFSNI